MLVARVHRPAGEERPKFARAVPGHRGDWNLKVLENAEDRLIRQQYAEDRRPQPAKFGLRGDFVGGGGVRREVQHALAERRFRPARLLREPVAPREGFFHLREHPAEVRKHVQVLRTLTREEQRNRALPRERLIEVVQAVGVSDLLTFRVREPVGARFSRARRSAAEPATTASRDAARPQFRRQRRGEFRQRSATDLPFDMRCECGGMFPEPRAIVAAQDEDFRVPPGRGRSGTRQRFGEGGRHREWFGK